MTESLEKGIVQRITRNLLDIQILRLIEAQPTWGYDIKKQISTKYGVILRHGSLYPLLNALEHRGFLVSRKQQLGGRTRKVYTITEEGQNLTKAYKRVLMAQLRESG